MQLQISRSRTSMSGYVLTPARGTPGKNPSQTGKVVYEQEDKKLKYQPLRKVEDQAAGTREMPAWTPPNNTPQPEGLALRV